MNSFFSFSDELRLPSAAGGGRGGSEVCLNRQFDACETGLTQSLMSCCKFKIVLLSTKEYRNARLIFWNIFNM